MPWKRRLTHSPEPMLLLILQVGAHLDPHFLSQKKTIYKFL